MCPSVRNSYCSNCRRHWASAKRTMTPSETTNYRSFSQKSTKLTKITRRSSEIESSSNHSRASRTPSKWGMSQMLGTQGFDTLSLLWATPISLRLSIRKRGKERWWKRCRSTNISRNPTVTLTTTSALPRTTSRATKNSGITTCGNTRTSSWSCTAKGRLSMRVENTSTSTVGTLTHTTVQSSLPITQGTKASWPAKSFQTSTLALNPWTLTIQSTLIPSSSCPAGRTSRASTVQWAHSGCCIQNTMKLSWEMTLNRTFTFSRRIRFRPQGTAAVTRPWRGCCMDSEISSTGRIGL